MAPNKTNKTTVSKADKDKDKEKKGGTKPVVESVTENQTAAEETSATATRPKTPDDQMIGTLNFEGDPKKRKAIEKESAERTKKALKKQAPVTPSFGFLKKSPSDTPSSAKKGKYKTIIRVRVIKTGSVPGLVWQFEHEPGFDSKKTPYGQFVISKTHYETNKLDIFAFERRMFTTFENGVQKSLTVDGKNDYKSLVMYCNADEMTQEQIKELIDHMIIVGNNHSESMGYGTNIYGLLSKEEHYGIDTTEGAVYADYVGTKNAEDMVNYKYRNEINTDNWGHENESNLDSFFREGTMTPQFAAKIHAPTKFIAGNTSE